MDFLPYLPWNLIQADFSRNQELGIILSRLNMSETREDEQEGRRDWDKKCSILSKVTAGIWGFGSKHPLGQLIQLWSLDPLGKNDSHFMPYPLLLIFMGIDSRFLFLCCPRVVLVFLAPEGVKRGSDCCVLLPIPAHTLHLGVIPVMSQLWDNQTPDEPFPGIRKG